MAPRFAGVPVQGPRFGGIPVEDPSSSSAYEDALADASRRSQFGPGTDHGLPPIPEPSWMDRILEAVDYADNTGAIVANRAGVGLTNMAGLPVDLANLATEGLFRGADTILPGDQSWLKASSAPVGGGQWLNQAREAVVPEAPAPQDAFQMVAGRVGEEVGAAMLPGMGVLGAAGKLGVQAARNSANPLVRTLVAPAAVSPSHFVATELAGSAAAGTGAGIANMFVDRDTAGGQVADMGGAFAGVGVAGLASALGRGLKNSFDAIRQNPNYVDQTVLDAVVDRVGKAAGLPGSEMQNGVFDTDQLVELIQQQNTRPSDIIPGYQESLADVTANPGIASLEYSRQSGPNSGLFTKQRGANNEAVDAAMRAIEPVETPGAFRSELETQRDLRLSAAAGDTQSAQSEFDAYIQNLQPTMLAEDRGATIRSGLDNSHRYAREFEDMAWSGLDGQVQTTPLADTLDQTIDGLSVARQQRIADMDQTVGIPRQLAGTAEEPAGPVNIQELVDMRSTLLQEQRNAMAGQQPDRNRAEALGRLIDDMNAYLDSDAVPADVRAQTIDARAVSRDVNERYNRPNDPISSVLAMSQGRPDVPDSAVASRFVQSDSRQASNIDRLLAETDLSSHGGSVREAVKDEILAGLTKAGPRRLDSYLGQFTQAFDRFPDLRDEVVEAAGAGRALDQASASETALIRDVGSVDGTVPGKGPVGKYLQYSDAQSERAINEVLNAKDPGRAADDLLTFIGDNPKAVEGARSAFWQKLRTESQSVDNSQRTMGGGRAWRGDWLKSFLNKPSTAAVADRLYRDNPEALANIQAYADVLDNVDLRQRGKAVGTSGTAQSVNPVLTPETLQSRFYAWKRGAIGGTYLLTSIAAVVARRAVRNAQGEAIERLTDQVLLNPKLAAALLKKNNPANRAALSRSAKLWLGNQASTFMNLLYQGDDDKPQEVQAEATPAPAAPAADAEQGDDDFWRAVLE